MTEQQERIARLEAAVRVLARMVRAEYGEGSLAEYASVYDDDSTPEQIAALRVLEEPGGIAARPA